jgi:hypothetical protein
MINIKLDNIEKKSCIKQYERNLYIFNKIPIFISNTSFKQNSKISKELRFYTQNILNNLIDLNKFKYCITMVCIGGESYLYGLTNNKINKIIHYTNSLSIYQDFYLNNTIYKKKYKNFLINYNSYQNIKNSDILIINNSKLNINLLNVINKRFYKYIIIINCHHIEFWKRIHILSNYKILSRKQFITKDYFVTVTVLEYKYTIPTFISLGNTCAITYQLKKLGLRKEAYPFDWCKINLLQLNKVLKNDFENFSNIIVKKFSSNYFYVNNKSKSLGSYILKNDYNILFAHELYENSLTELTNFQNKLNIRINRFKSLKNSYIVFIILDVNNQALLIDLINNLKKYFNTFKILYININNLENNLDLDYNLNKNINILENNNYVKCITINNNIIDWGNWKHSNLNWHNIIFNNL